MNADAREDKKFRILSLDGGGSWALIQVRTLQALYGEDARGHAVLAHFDLVAANSGGALVLGALLENMPLTAIAQLFLDAASRAKLFAPLGLTHIVDKVLQATLHVGAKYSTVAKLAGIQALLPGIGGCALNALPPP